jgi:putative hemolysin
MDPTIVADVVAVPGPQPAADSDGRYRCSLVRDAATLRAAQALRFRVFNLELHEGLAQSWTNGLDADRFDACCDHLIVEHVATAEVIGTYRLQTGTRAAAGEGYYSEREFDFAPYEALRGELVELGRACIAAEHRHFGVLNLLWGGIAAYARAHGARYLIGCSSLTSQDARVGASAWRQLEAQAAPASLRTAPRPAYACALDRPADVPPPLPKLLSAYLMLGAQVCGPPAIDREFKTIDFLTLLDLQSPLLAALQRRGRFAPLPGLL